MGLRINTNVMSMSAQNNLKSTSAKLNTSLERLSTGLRINSGKDDAVGLAISEGLRSQVRGIDVAKNNISNAASVFGVAEGYLSQLTEVAQQMREVAVQAASNTLNSNDRDSLETKFSTLSDEYNRLSQGANFGGVSLLDGSFIGKSIQVGAKEGESLSISIGSALSSSIGQVAIMTAAAVTARATTGATLSLPGDGVVTINNVGMGTLSDDGVSNAQSSESAIAYVNAINSVSGTTGVSAVALANVVKLSYTVGGGDEFSASAVITINGVTVKAAGSGEMSHANDTDAQEFVNMINAKTADTGVTASIDMANDKIILTANDGRNIDFSVSGAAGYNTLGITGNTAYSQVVHRGSFKLTSQSTFTLGNASDDLATTTTSVAVDTATSLSTAEVDSAANASTAISILDSVITQLQNRRATVGSTSNRLDIAAAELDSRQENLSSAESAIRDADIAAETAKLTQQQILQQAGVTVLGQANSAPQIALTLLQNI